MALNETLQQGINQLTTATQIFQSESARHEASRNDMIARINEFVNSFAQRNAVTLEVGVGKPYASINDAYNVIRDKVLTAPVLIKVGDGVYKENVINLGSHPFAHKIRIEGNVANPSNCVIQWTAGSTGDSHGILLYGCNGINISGFKFVGSCTESNFTHRSLYVANRSHLFSDDNSLIFDGGFMGVQVIQSGFLGYGIQLRNIAQATIFGSQNSSIISSAMLIDGNGMSNKVATPNRYKATLGDSIESRGVWVLDNSFSHVAESKFSNLTYGAIAEKGANLEFSKTSYDRCHVGVLATYGANTQSFKESVAISCEVGFVADQGAQMLVDGAKASGCTIAGFRASGCSGMYGDKTKAANNVIGYQSISGSTLNVPNSNAAALGNTILRDVDAHSTLIWS